MSETREEKRLRRDCAELYQVIGTLAAAHGDLFDHPEVIKALDNAIAAANNEPRPHDDLLPFAPLPVEQPLDPRTVEACAKVAEGFEPNFIYDENGEIIGDDAIEGIAFAIRALTGETSDSEKT